MRITSCTEFGCVIPTRAEPASVMWRDSVLPQALTPESPQTQTGKRTERWVSRTCFYQFQPCQSSPVSSSRTSQKAKRHPPPQKNTSTNTKSCLALVKTVTKQKPRITLPRETQFQLSRCYWGKTAQCTYTHRFLCSRHTKQRLT